MKKLIIFVFVVISLITFDVFAKNSLYQDIKAPLVLNESTAMQKVVAEENSCKNYPFHKVCDGNYQSNGFCIVAKIITCCKN